MTWTNPVVHFESAEAYHSRPDATSASQTKDHIESPRGYFRKHALGISKEATSFMEFGSAVHEETLLEAVERSYLVIPKEVLSSSGSKAGNAWRDYKAANADRLLLKESEVASMNMILESLKKHPLGRSLVDDTFAYKELTITADATVLQHAADGSGFWNIIFPVRGRLDYVQPERRIKDLKTTGDLSPKAMRYKPYDMGWDISGEYYRRLWHALTGEWLWIDFIVVETKEPYRVEVWSPKQSTLDAASERIDQAHQEMFSNWSDFKKNKDENIWNRHGFDQICEF